MEGERVGESDAFGLWLGEIYFIHLWRKWFCLLSAHFPGYKTLKEATAVVSNSVAIYHRGVQAFATRPCGLLFLFRAVGGKWELIEEVVMKRAVGWEAVLGRIGREG